MKPLGPAIVLPRGVGHRIAAFVWWGENSFAWLEPDYLEPDPPPRSGFHVWEGEIGEKDGNAWADGKHGRATVFDRANARENPDVFGPHELAALARFDELLAARGTTWAEERKRVERLLAVELAELD
ncbi:hypothetical protein [Luteimonas sp. e5]